MIDLWNAKVYSQFIDLRTRPARDLLSAIPMPREPKLIYDLGCGPGNSTILLKNQWPDADVIGVDSSADMLEEARSLYPNINFIAADIAEFTPKEKIDCLFANASLQWVPNHQGLLPKLIGLLNPGGVLAIQMPNNFHYPTHQVTIKILKNNLAWQPYLKKLFYGPINEPLFNMNWYYDLVMKSKLTFFQGWETTYFQEMSSYQDIFNWVKGTGLRPVLSAMDSPDKILLEKAYLDAIANEYPLQGNNKILLPFKRFFIVIQV